MAEAPLKVWLEAGGALLRLRLARPKANILDAEMIGALSRSFASYKANKGLLAAMLEWQRPILVAARGNCLGGGLELAAAGHLLFLAPGAQLGQPEMKLGVFAPAASVLLPLRIGQARAEDLLVSGRSIDAPAALAWGLANEIAADPAAAALLYFDQHLSKKSAASLSLAVRAARESFADLARARLADAEALYLEKLMSTRDANEGLQAFIAKRQPVWEHR